MPRPSQDRSHPGSRREREAAVRLLTICLARETEFDPDAALDLVRRSSPAVVLEMARYHRVGGSAYQRLRSLPVPESLAGGLREMYSEAVHRHLRTVWALSRLQPVLDASEVPWTVIKGPVLAELVYGDPGMRTYNDLDLLVEPRRFRDVVELLELTGAKLLDRNWKVIRREVFGELHLLLDAGVMLDLHWSLVTIYRGRTAMSSTEVLARRQRVALAGVPAWSLEPVDQLLHLAVHAALSGADKLVWIKDIDLAVGRSGLNWDAVAERAERWRIGAPVGLMLSRVADTLGTPVPDGLPDRLLGRYYAGLVRLVDRASPWQHALGRVTTPSLLLSRSIGQGPLGGARWFVRRSIRSLDPREPVASFAFTPRGDSSDRDAFFEAVASAQPPPSDADGSDGEASGHRDEAARR